MTIGKDFLYSILFLFFFVLFKSPQEGLAVQCGKDAGGALCAGGLCCSQYGYCGSDSNYCGNGCQSQCKRSPTPSTPSTPSQGGVSSIVTSSIFDRFFDHHSDGGCPSNNFYTYNAFIQATKSWPTFGNSGDANSKKRELAAFFANAAHETTGGCYKEEISKSNSYCSASAQWPCAAGKKYYGRGPLQITWNYNYGQAGKSLGFDGINDPDIVARDATTSFKTAIWFWMTPQSPKASCHDAISNGQGFGSTIKIINGGIECGSSTNPSQQSRIKYYKSFCQILGVDPGNNLTC